MAIFSRKKPLQKASRIYKKFQNLRKINSLKIVQSDKNSGLVALHIQDYHNMIMEHLNDPETYKCLGPVANNSTWKTTLVLINAQHTQLLHTARENYRILPKNSIQFLKQSKDVLPIFHCLPKLHKKNRPGRPIVGSPNWLTTNWSILLDCLLEKITVQFALKNSLVLIPDLEGKLMQPSYLFVTADVTSLYTKMSLTRLFSVIQQRTNNPFLVEILRFICENNFFQYGNDIFQQLDGIAMGTNCAVICANLYMEAFDHEFAPRMIYYRRYIDDIIFIADLNWLSLDFTISEMNNFIPGIKLEFIDSTDSINFLDLTIFKNSDNFICFKTFQKPYNIYQYLPPFSNHTPSTIRGYIKGEIIRYIRTNTQLMDRRYQVLKFYNHLLDRGFPKNYLEKIFNSVNIQIRKPLHYTLPDEDFNKIPFIIPFYNNQLRIEIQQAIKKLNDSTISEKLKIKIFATYKKTKNVLELATRSNISQGQIKYLHNAAPADGT